MDEAFLCSAFSLSDKWEGREPGERGDGGARCGECQDCEGWERVDRGDRERSDRGERGERGDRGERRPQILEEDGDESEWPYLGCLLYTSDAADE